MSKLLENKQIVHIATEVVILIGITFYFSSKNRNLLNHIEDLSTKIEDLEDLVQKHERIINHLLKVINTSQPPPKPEPQLKQIPKRSIKKPSFKKEEVKVSFKEDVKLKPAPKPVIMDDNFDESSDDSDLDKEIEEELNELIQEEKTNQTSIDSLDENVVEIDVEDGLNES